MEPDTTELNTSQPHTTHKKLAFAATGTSGGHTALYYAWQRHDRVTAIAAL
jgi:hypothetical protein